jgi:hypothetical protein
MMDMGGLEQSKGAMTTDSAWVLVYEFEEQQWQRVRELLR